jgi:hypothetical protein
MCKKQKTTPRTTNLESTAVSNIKARLKVLIFSITSAVVNKMQSVIPAKRCKHKIAVEINAKKKGLMRIRHF